MVDKGDGASTAAGNGPYQKVADTGSQANIDRQKEKTRNGSSCCLGKKERNGGNRKIESVPQRRRAKGTCDHGGGAEGSVACS